MRSGRTLILAGVILMAAHPEARAVVETDASTTFAAGTTGYQSSVPPTTSNLLSSGNTLLNASAAPYPDGKTSLSYSTLVDGSFGIVPPTGGGGIGEVAIASNTTLTYDLNQVTGFNVTDVDIFSGWGDSGRFKPTVTVRYTTADDPFTWVTLQAVNYTTAVGNSAFVNLSSVGVSRLTRIQFVFPVQQNGYVGYTELSVLGTQSALVGDVWQGGTSSDWGTGANWVGGTVPAPGDKVNFGLAGSTGTVDLGNAGRSVSGLTFQPSVSTTIGSTQGQTLTLDNGATAVLLTAAGTHAITSAVALNSDLTTNTLTSGQFTFSGVISESARHNLYAGGPGKLILSGTNNSYTGNTIIQDGTLNFASIANFGQPSSLGNRASDAVGTTPVGNVGLLFRGGTLQYTGSTPQTTNRAIRVNADGGDGFTGGATLDASGSTPAATLSFTATSSPDFFEQSGTRTLTFTGSNTGNNLFALTIPQAGGITSVIKSGAGKWVLTGNSTYTGPTTVRAVRSPLRPRARSASRRPSPSTTAARCSSPAAGSLPRRRR